MKPIKRNLTLLRHLVLPVLLLITAYIAIRYYNFVNSIPLDITEDSQYEYHFAMITNGQNNPYWSAVYDGACQAAAPYHAYVELVGNNLLDDNSVADKLDMARYCNYDGILVYPEDSSDVERNINSLVSDGTPVITLQRDSDASNRQAFVGVNDYFLGQAYGREIKGLSQDNFHYISVLFPGSTFGSENRKWFMQGLQNTLGSDNYSIDFRVVKDDNGLSNSENIIDSLITGAGDHRSPDTIICLDNQITELAYQIISDRCMLERTSIIGSFMSDSILNYIDNGGIKFTIVPKPGDIGAKAIEELIRYRNYGVANYSSSVDLMIVDKNNAYDLQEDSQ